MFWEIFKTSTGFKLELGIFLLIRDESFGNYRLWIGNHLVIFVLLAENRSAKQKKKSLTERESNSRCTRLQLGPLPSRLPWFSPGSPTRIESIIIKLFTVSKSNLLKLTACFAISEIHYLYSYKKFNFFYSLTRNILSLLIKPLKIFLFLISLNRPRKERRRPLYFIDGIVVCLGLLRQLSKA